MLSEIIYATAIRQKQNQRNLTARQSMSGSARQTTGQNTNAKAKSAGNVFSVGWRPVPTFFRSSRG